ncbi:hypothetical protein [Actinocorallia populi]|uniref:hypothetical protein n=1 Tax=Actinocorallia populi TaxID=2079200 RepID=UPI000D0976B9|nr:hypothetical protein [Actinocorallia populi]
MSMQTGALHRPATAEASPLLRRVLWIDSVSTAASGVLLLAAARPLEDLLGLPVAWGVPLGIALLGWALAVALVVDHPDTVPRHVAFVIGGNALSAAGLVVLALTDLVPLTGLGVAFMLLMALIVAAYAELQFTGLRRSTR